MRKPPLFKGENRSWADMAITICEAAGTADAAAHFPDHSHGGSS
jgi:hypothetical protein